MEFQEIALVITPSTTPEGQEPSVNMHVKLNDGTELRLGITQERKPKYAFEKLEGEELEAWFKSLERRPAETNGSRHRNPI